MESSLADVEDDGGAGYTWEGEYERPWLVTVCFDVLLLLVSFYHYFKNICISLFFISRIYSFPCLGRPFKRTWRVVYWPQTMISCTNRKGESEY